MTLRHCHRQRLDALGRPRSRASIKDCPACLNELAGKREPNIEMIMSRLVRALDEAGAARATLSGLVAENLREQWRTDLERAEEALVLANGLIDRVRQEAAAERDELLDF